MNDLILHKFQNDVAEVLIRHKNILDVVSKYQESCAKVNRAIIKSTTSCGCIQIYGEKQNIPDNISFHELKDFMDHQISGKLCDICKDKIEEELGNHLFYLTALCNALDLDLYDIFIKEYKQIKTLGKYNLY